LKHLISDLGGLRRSPDRASGPRQNVAPIPCGHRLVCVLAVFSWEAPVVPGASADLAEEHSRSNCQTLFGILPSRRTTHPPDADGGLAAAFDGLFGTAIAAVRRRIGWRVPAPGACSDRAGRDRALLLAARSIARNAPSAAARMVALSSSTRSSGRAWWPPDHKQDPCRCRRSSSSRRMAPRSRIASATPPSAWLAKQGPALAAYRRSTSATTCCLPADRHRHPEVRRQFHPDLQSPAPTRRSPNTLPAPKLEEHSLTVQPRGPKSASISTMAIRLPLRATEDALEVNWFSVEIRDAKGKRTYYTASSRTCRSPPRP